MLTASAIRSPPGRLRTMPASWTCNTCSATRRRRWSVAIPPPTMPRKRPTRMPRSAPRRGFWRGRTGPVNPLLPKQRVEGSSPISRSTAFAYDARRLARLSSCPVVDHLPSRRRVSGAFRSSIRLVSDADSPALSRTGSTVIRHRVVIPLQGVCQISDNQRSAVGVLISAGWLGRHELPDQRTPAREEESSLDGERDVSFVAMSDSEILSQRIEGGTEA